MDSVSRTDYQPVVSHLADDPQNVDLVLLQQLANGEGYSNETAGPSDAGTTVNDHRPVANALVLIIV